MRIFIDELAKSLCLYHQCIEVFDVVTDSQLLGNLTSRRFKAIIGIQTNLINSFIGKKYLIQLDHPITMHGYFSCSSEDCYLLTHDRNYLSLIYSYSRSIRQFAAHFLFTMRSNPDFTAEKAFSEVLDAYDLVLNSNEFLDLFANMKPVTDCIMFYFREKTIRTLLDAGIEIHVYGDSWKTAPFANHKFLIQHPALPMEETLSVIQKSKISLNIMSWHKDGLTERILNAMLCQTVVLSDKSTRLEEEFVDEKDIILFDIAKPECLPNKIRHLLSDENYLKHLAMNGYKKAMEKHLWCHRAHTLLNYIEFP